jgi:hypothetical protein
MRTSFVIKWCWRYSSTSLPLYLLIQPPLRLFQQINSRLLFHATMTSGTDAVTIVSQINPKLNGHNYMQWSERVIMALSLFSLSVGTTPTPNGSDQLLRSILLLSMEEEQYDACKAALTSKEIWDIAMEKYGNPSPLMIGELQTEFYGTRIGSERVQAYVNRKRNIAQLKNAGHDVSPYLTSTILVGVRSQYDSVVESLGHVKNLTLTNLESRLLAAEEARLKQQSIMQVTCKTTTERIRCDHCGKPGHVKKNCFKLHTCTKCGTL